MVLGAKSSDSSFALWSVRVTSCSNCGTQNTDSVDLCRKCGVLLNSLSTMSISSQTAVERVRGTLATPSHSNGFAPGSMFAGRYRIVSLLGRGGMGEVYGADDLKLGQRVALKFLPVERGKRTSWRDQFYAEVRNARQVSHPNVCRVYDVGESDGRLFLSMEFVDGEDLSSLLRRIGRLPGDKAVEVAQQLCAGVAAAHRAGLLHRDLKPSNVMIDGKGRARITDFGLAIAASEAEHEANPAGTAGYLAPELLDGTSPSIQSDLYALGLVLYELFTGKRAFEGSNLAKFHRKQSETDPKPPSALLKDFNPVVERAILRCLDRDPSQRPRSAMSVAAALPGGDPLAAAIAAGETPSPEMVAAAGPVGGLRPKIAWTYLIATIILMFGAAIFFMPRETDWGLAEMNKSPEVLADRARELGEKLGYPGAMDHALWINSEQEYIDYASRKVPGGSAGPSSGRAWPSPVSFLYRQSPQWMTPSSFWVSLYSWVPTLNVLLTDPPNEIAGMLTLKLDTQGKLLFLRAVPPQAEPGEPARDQDWNLLFAEAGLDKSQFSAASPKWDPPEVFDVRADWEGHAPGRPDLPLHIAAAARYGRPVYFQVIAPWDRRDSSIQPAPNTESKILSLIFAILLSGYVLIGGFFARRNMLLGRADSRGGTRLAVFVALMLGVLTFASYHFVPVADYVTTQFCFLGIPLFFALLSWIGYMALEPSIRRTWPKLMVSWQRLLAGRFRDPLVGHDVLLGCLGGSIIVAVTTCVSSFAGISEAGTVVPFFGRGLFPCLAYCLSAPARTCIIALFFIAILRVMSSILRKRSLGLVATGVVIAVIVGGQGGSLLDFVMGAAWASLYLLIQNRSGLVASASFMVYTTLFNDSPPLQFSRWYAGRSMVALMVPLALVVYGFYVSLGGQQMLGSARTMRGGENQEPFQVG